MNVKMKVKTEKFYWEKLNVTKSLSMTQNHVQFSLKVVCWSVASVLPSDKLLAKNNSCVIVRLSSDVIVRWDYRPNHSSIPFCHICTDLSAYGTLFLIVLDVFM